MLVYPQFEWDKYPHETDEEFHAFRAYLHMPATARTVQGAAELASVAPHLARLWYTNFAWDLRARAYDTHVIGTALKNHKEMEIIERHRTALQEVQDATEMLALWRSLLPTVADARDFLSLVKARDEISKLMRRAVRMPLAYQEVLVEDNDQHNELVL